MDHVEQDLIPAHEVEPSAGAFRSIWPQAEPRAAA
jgi:hypothetical protein